MKSLLFAAAMACATAHGVENPPDPGLDITVLQSRVKVSNEYVDREFGGSENTTKLNLAYAFGLAARRDWTVQLDLPVVASRAASNTTTSDATGLGDIQMRIAHVFDPEGLFRWALGVEAQFDSASEPQLGDGVFRLSPLLAIAVQPCRAFKFQLFAQYDQSLVTASGIEEQQDLKVKPAVKIQFPSRCYLYVETELKWAMHDDGKFGAKLKLEVGRGFGPRGNWILSARYEMPLVESRDQNTFTAACSYVFQ